MQVNLTELEGTEAQQYTQAVLTSQEYQNFKQRMQQRFPGVLTPQEDSLEVTVASAEGDKAVLVRVFVDGGPGNSCLLAVFDGEATHIDATDIRQTRSILFTGTQQGHVRVITEVNGIGQLDATFTATGVCQEGTLTRNGKAVPLDGLNAEKAALRISGADVQTLASSRVTCVKNCLVRNGIGPLTATAFILACLGSETGIGFIICAVGFGIAGG